MNLLWVMADPGALRRLERPLARLAERGHRVHVAHGRVRSPNALKAMHRLGVAHPELTFSCAPRADVSLWAPFTASVRGAIDYARYLEPGAPSSLAMAMRVRKRSHPRVAAELDRHRRGRALIVRVLRHLERCLEPPAEIQAWIADLHPDVVAVTPLAGAASEQAEFVRASQNLGVPVVFPVLNWDNLASEELVRDVPGLALVWNANQADDLRSLHGVPDDRIGTLAEHADQLREVIGSGARDVNQRFAASFLRPEGVSGSTAAFVAAIESLASRDSRAPRRAPFGASATRALVRRYAHRYAPRATHRAVGRERRLAGLAAERREATSSDLAHALAGDGPIIAGPFDGEVGHELNYWIPFLQTLVEGDPLLRGRLVILSRGGVASWYSRVSDRYLDVYDLLPVDDALAVAEASRAERGGQRRQFAITAGDLRLLGLARERLGFGEVANLHPSVAVAPAPSEIRLRPLLLGALPFAYRPLAAGEVPPGIDLPERFVAVRLYGSRVLCVTPEHQALIADTVARIAEHVPVVALEPGRSFDDHADFCVEANEQVTIVRGDDPCTNLAVQSAVLGRAAACVCTYGGVGILSVMLGRPTIALVASRRARVQSEILTLIERFARAPGFGPHLVIEAHQGSDIIPALEARGALSVDRSSRPRR